MLFMEYIWMPIFASGSGWQVGAAASEAAEETAETRTSETALTLRIARYKDIVSTSQSQPEIFPDILYPKLPNACRLLAVPQFQIEPITNRM
jgi:hypothetical protein